MLTKIFPQKVVNEDSGYMIQVADRYHVEYIENDRRAVIEVDFGPIVGIYRDSLKLWITPLGSYPIADDDCNTILSRVDEALRFMGSKVEYC